MHWFFSHSLTWLINRTRHTPLNPHAWITQKNFQKQIHNSILSQKEILELTQLYSQISFKHLTQCPPSHAQIQGKQHSPFLGSSMEYEESRPYTPGDEIRHLNWRLMAKTGQPYTKYFQAERQENIFILVDHRPSMRFGTRIRLKATQASRIAGYFAWYAQQHALPVTGIRLTHTLAQTPELTSRESYETIMQLFSSPCPPASSSDPQPLPFNQALHTLYPQIKAGTHCIFISDFQDINSHTSSLLQALQQKACITAIYIQDPIEQNLPNIIPLHLQTLMGEFVMTLTTPSQQRAYQNWAQHHHHTILTHLQAADLSPLHLATHAPLNTLEHTPFLMPEGTEYANPV